MITKDNIILSFALLSFFLCFSQACVKGEKYQKGDTNPPFYQFEELVPLPPHLKSSSGIAIDSKGNFWSHNDSGGKAELRAFNDNGDPLRTLHISNAVNIDWEDIAKDANGYFYIGDFGNNDNDRRDLTIYKIPDPASIQEDTVLAEIIHFQYPDQQSFPPPTAAWFFDAESFFASHDSLYILTKDRSEPYVGKTKMYSLPTIPGDYVATFQSEFFTSKKHNIGSVTSADLSPDASLMVMLSNKNVWIFSHFEPNSFFGGAVESYKLPDKLQLEGIVFKDNCELYLCAEKKGKQASALFRLRICK